MCQKNSLYFQLTIRQSFYMACLHISNLFKPLQFCFTFFSCLQLLLMKTKPIKRRLPSDLGVSACDHSAALEGVLPRLHLVVHAVRSHLGHRRAWHHFWRCQVEGTRTNAGKQEASTGSDVHQGNVLNPRNNMMISFF